MIGGGLDAFIGAVHRNAAALDQEIELVCGAFSSDPEKSRKTGESLYLNPSRTYDSWEEMIIKEKELPAHERMDFVAIVTPNHLHFGPAKLALEQGFHVMSDKPLCYSLDEALELKRLVDESGLLFGLTHTYSGYPMIKEGKQRVIQGEIGRVRKIYVEYPQGWLSQNIESEGQKQASWRTDPARSGKSGCMGDIGTHAAHLAEYVSGLEITELCADLIIVVEGRALDDDGAVFLKFNNGASGVLTATQIATGEENNVKLRVYGEKGGLEWNHADANSLLIKRSNGTSEVLRTGAGSAHLSDAANMNTRLPAGHPEGYIEAFANIYRNFAIAIKAKMKGEKAAPFEIYDYPGVNEGVRGMRFIDKVVASSEKGSKWVDFGDG